MYVPATLMVLFSQLKTFMKIFLQNKQPPKVPLRKFSAKFLTERKSQANNFSFEANVFLEKTTKSINSQTNLKSLGHDGLTAEFYKHLPNEL